MIFFHLVIKSIKTAALIQLHGVRESLDAHWSVPSWCSRRLVIGRATCPSRLWRRQKEAEVDQQPAGWAPAAPT